MKNKIVYMAMCNLNGLITPRPLKLFWNKEYQIYLDKSKDWSIEEIGLIEKDMVTEYSSFNKKDVEIFIEGCQAINRILKNLL